MNNLATSFRLHYASHSWLIAVSVTALILSVFECVEISSPNPFYWILYSCYMLTILVLPAWPRQGSWLMLAISYLLPLFEGPRYPAILLGEIIALSVLAYYAKSGSPWSQTFFIRWMFSPGSYSWLSAGQVFYSAMSSAKKAEGRKRKSAKPRRNWQSRDSNSLKRATNWP